jgi:hypothetical protein
MSFDEIAFEKLRSDRLAYVDGLRRNKGFEAGILRLLTQLYPDNAHFIYELLQNAEDAKASHAKFTLATDYLFFEHDGERLFTARDVESITSIGDSTKADSPTEIGKFGVGFKAVFAYTKTPEIYSGDYRFRICDLVVPELIKFPKKNSNGLKTRFVFPFNHPEKPSQQAAHEIAAALKALNDATLLFLANISKITFVLPDFSEGQLERILPAHLQQTESKSEHLEVSVRSAAGELRRSHWLRYRKVVTINDESTLKYCTVAVAFGLEEAEGRSQRSPWRVVPLRPGCVCIYFPADKETSNLRFHIHAPFASTVARDSVRDSPGNDQLLASVAALAAESLEDIRDRGLLTVAALETLPIDEDNLSPFYAPITVAIVEAFKSRSLVPTKSGSHRIAENLFRGPSDIVNLISDEDLAAISGAEWVTPLWCANPPQVNQRADKFLDSLAIDDWGWRELCNALECNSPTLEWEGDPTRPERLTHFLSRKNDVWLRRFYSLLHDATKRHDCYLDVSDLALVRVDSETGTRMVKPVEAFFTPPDEALAPTDILLVRRDTYSSGKSESQKSAARLFLEEAGVRVFDEEAELFAIIDRCYRDNSPDQEIHLKHIKRFMSFLSAFPQKTQVFHERRVFLGERVGNEEDLDWCLVKELFIDTPFEETGLSAILGSSGQRKLWSGYEKVCAKAAFLDFVKALGIQADLPIVRTFTCDNPAIHELRADYFRAGVRWMDSAIDDDWTINDIESFVKTPTLESSRLLWKALTNAHPEVRKAKFRPNKQYAVREADSQLICWLKAYAWVPNANGEFHKPQDISRDQLPQGLLFDDRNGLLTAIGFEERLQRQSAEYRRKDHVAREVGFDGLESATELANAVRESGMDPKTAAALIKRHADRPELPVEEVCNPLRRRIGVMESRDNAPANSAVLQERSILPNLQRVVAEAKAYLRAKYTNVQGQMVCQACSNEMPFKLRTGEYYFEAVQALKGLAQHFYENRLALCPTCAAMYQFARGGTDDYLRATILSSNSENVEAGVKVSMVLADASCTIYFVGTHFFDLQVVISQENATD